MNEIKEIFSNIWIKEVDTDDFHVRGVLMLGDERALVWDTLTHPRDMAEFLPLIGDRELVVVYSHADWDHIWGTAGLNKSNRVVIGHSTCLNRFTKDVPLTLKERKSSEPRVWDEVKLVPPLVTFQNELEIDLGGLMVSLHSLPGHTLDSIVAFLPESGIFLGGDTIETPFPVINPDSPVNLWVDALMGWVEDERVREVIPAHGEIGKKEIFHANIQYLKGLMEGAPVSIPTNMSSFYQQTHVENLRHFEILRSG